MKVLVVGSGGREHALCWKLKQSSLCRRLFCAPGNAGIAAVATCVPVDVMDFDGLVTFCKSEGVEFVVVGPEVPLVAGLVDRLESEGIAAFGPGAGAARLEGSKAFMKDLCRKYGIPTAAYGHFTEVAAAKAFVRDRGMPMVVKTDGLAAGKGVIVARSVDATLAAIDEIRSGFGAAASEFVVEEILQGEEASFFALCDGTHVLPLAAAQDHKTIGEGDTGPNTGGMGTYSPVPVVDAAMTERIMTEIVKPTLAGMAAEGVPYKGVLFAGVMIGPDGPKLLEYNVRFGDPEAQVLMVRMSTDLLPAMLAARDGALNKFSMAWSKDAAVCVVMAARGYPGAYAKGTVIENLEAAGKVDGVIVLHAGT
ncbi:MAG: phosphoribosylamine--glycine ligase, partial [Alphaproteobacteria bacterium]|nr:phosphoribosylamine--glycine ligase [Alphaproteobacteria bacterium]